MDNKRIRMILSVSLNVILAIVGIIIVLWAGGKAYEFGHNIFDEESITTVVNAKDVEVTIAEGVTPKQLAKTLHAKGWVKDELICYLQIMLSDYKDKFAAGTYTLNTGMTPTDMMKVMCNIATEEE